MHILITGHQIQFKGHVINIQGSFLALSSFLISKASCVRAVQATPQLTRTEILRQAQRCVEGDKKQVMSEIACEPDFICKMG